MIDVYCRLLRSTEPAKIYYSDLEKQGFDTPIIQGSNNLIRKRALVQMVQEYLFKKYPTMAESTNIVFNWLPTEAFCRNAGPRLWYNNSTINVYEIQEVGIDSVGIFRAYQIVRNHIKKYLDLQ